MRLIQIHLKQVTTTLMNYLILHCIEYHEYHNISSVVTSWGLVSFLVIQRC